jgi:hypothetical protein
MYIQTAKGSKVYHSENKSHFYVHCTLCVLIRCIYFNLQEMRGGGGGGGEGVKFYPCLYISYMYLYVARFWFPVNNKFLLNIQLNL